MAEFLHYPPPIAHFDGDGTLLDTYDLIYKAFLATIEEHKLEKKTKAEIDATMGFPLTACYEVLAPGKNIEQLCQTHRDFQAKNPELIKPFPNTLAALNELKNEGVKLTLITARTRDSAIANIERTGIEPFIDLVVGGEDVSQPKPDPEGIIRATGHLKGTLYRATMAGDSGVDIQAGQWAGVKTIAAAYGFEGPKIALNHPDYTVNDIAQMVPIILLELNVISKTNFLDRLARVFI